MLRGLQLHSFKAFHSEWIPLSPLTALIGANGVGKTTILQAIELFGGLTTHTITEHLQARKWEYADLPHLRGRDLRFGATALLELEGERIRWELILEKRRRNAIHYECVSVSDPEDDTLFVESPELERHGRQMRRFDHEELDWEPEIKQSLGLSFVSSVDPTDESVAERRALARRFPTLVTLNEWARNIRGYFFLDPRTMRSSSRGGGGDIGEAGNRLAAFVDHLRRRRRDAFGRLVERVQHYYPPLVALSTRRHGPGWATIEVTERWGSEEATFNARQVSDGLLRLIAIAALYELDPPPSVVLLDEIENGLHPHLLGSVVEMLQDFVDEREGRSQVIFTTHSPLTINFVRDPSQVLLVHRLKKGIAKVTPLNETRDFDELRKAFDLGELWYNVGEELLTTPRRRPRKL